MYLYYYFYYYYLYHRHNTFLRKHYNIYYMLDLRFLYLIGTRTKLSDLNTSYNNIV